MGTITIEPLAVDLNSEARAALAEADVIIGVDIATEREFTVFGTPSLESTTSMKRLSAMRVVRVPVDCGQHELEKLLALVRSVKSRDDRDAGDD